MGQPGRWCGPFLDGEHHKYVYDHTGSMGHYHKCFGQLHDCFGAGADVLNALLYIQGLAT